MYVYKTKKRQSVYKLMLNIHNFVTVFISLCVSVNCFLGYIRYPSVSGDDGVVISMMFQAKYPLRLDKPIRE